MNCIWSFVYSNVFIFSVLCSTVAFASSAPWELYKAKGASNPFHGSITPSEKTTMEYGAAKSTHSGIARENVPLVETKCEPEAKVKFSHGGVGCTKMQMRESMAEHVNKYFLVCVQEAARSAGIVVVTHVEVQTSGCYEDRKTKAGKISNHARGRACDISGFTLEPGGQKMAGKMPESETGSNKKFYDTFRSCWQESIFMSSNGACQGKPGESGSGSIGAPGHGPPPEMHDHCDHIHLSFPECADKGGR
jgi:hypothetical protein